MGLTGLFSRTLKNTVTGRYIKAVPARPGSGLTINGVAVIPENVVKADVRVDLGTGMHRSMIIEHVTGPVRLLGLTDLAVEGLPGPWDFMRPEHRFAYSTGQESRFVVGPPDGCLHPDFVAAALATGSQETPGGRRSRTVAGTVRYESGGGFIELRPAPPGTGVTLNLRLGTHEIRGFHFDPLNGLSDHEFLERIVSSPTPFLIGPDDPRALTHAVGDVCGDLTGVGGFTDLAVDAELCFFYHALTIGAVHRARPVEVIYDG